MTLLFLKGKSKGKTKHGKGNIDTVALTPAGTVQENGGQEQNNEEADDCAQMTPVTPANKQETCIGKDDIKKDAQEFDEVEITNRREREEGQKIQIWNIVITY